MSRLLLTRDSVSLWVLIVATLVCFSAFSQVTKWVDEQGRVHYGPSAPASVSSARIDTKLSVVQSNASPEVLTLYTTSWCGYCKRARAYLDRNSIEYVVHDIEKSAAAQVEFNKLGRGGVPLLVDENRKIRGFSASRYAAFLK